MNTAMNWLLAKARAFARRIKMDSVHARRSGVTLAEALVLIIVAGNLMVPVIGTLHNGIERTNRYAHQDRMRTIAQGEMAKILTEASFMRLPVVSYIATKTWPLNDPEPIATYVMEIETLENIQLATLTSTITGDFPDPDNVVGTQPSNLKAVVITVTNLSDGEDPANPMQIRMYSMVAIPRSFNPNRIYISDKDNICIYAIDPKTRNVVETFPLPKQNQNITAANNKSSRPGNIAVHPNTNWILTQREQTLLWTNVAILSPIRRSSFQAYATSSTFLEDPNDNEKVRKDRGVAFRPDGRFCYVTSHSPSCVSIFSVPETLPASLTFQRSLTTGGDKITDLQVGEDGYLYIGDYSYSSKCFRRLNMYAPPSQAVLEDFDVKPNKEPIAACTSRDGRDVYAVWKDGLVTVSSSTITTGWASATISVPAALGEDLQDIQITGDNAIAVVTSKKGGGNTRIYGLSIPIQPSRITSWSLPNQLAYPGSGEVTNQAVLSPTMNEVWVDRKSAGVIYAIDGEGLAAGSYTTAIASDRVVTFLPNGDAGCVAAKPPELVAVGCSGVNSIEFIDPYSKYHYEDLRQGGYYGTPRQLAFDRTGSRLSVCYDLYSTLPSEHDVFSQKRLADIDPEAWGVTTQRRPTHHVYFQNGGRLIQKYGSVVSSNGYISIDRNGVKQADEDFPLTASMSDVLALNDGGALVLVTNTVEGWTRLDRIGPDATIWTRWDSRFDDFPTHGATRMAVSPDDSLLAIYIPTIGGNPEQIQIFDLRANDFGKLTQQNGLISEVRNSTSGRFDVAPYITHNSSTLSATNRPIIEAFTANDSISAFQNYPANFWDQTGYRFRGHAQRYFGYFQPGNYSISSLGGQYCNYFRLFLDSTVQWLAWNVNAGYPFYQVPAAFTTGHSTPFQMDSGDQANDDIIGAVFFSINPADPAPTSSTNDGTTVTGLTAGDWKRTPSSLFRPLRFTPQNIGTWVNPSTNTNPNRMFMAYSRDIASPTLWVFNAETSRLLGIPYGGNPMYSGLVASIGADLSMGMAIAPDGQRLMIAAANPNRVYLVDVSTPVQNSFMKVIDHIELSQPPTCIAARPFARVNSKKNTYEVAAEMASGIGGSNMAAVASGGIYVVGATSCIFGTSSQKVLAFNPLLNTLTDKGNKLLRAVDGHSVFSYDGNLYAMNGRSTSTNLAWVQRWNPTTNIASSSVDPTNNLPTGLISHWKFDETSGTTAADSVGTNHGTIAGNPVWTAGKYGNCLQFDGNGDYVNCGNNTSLKFGSSDFTISLWFNTTVIGQDVTSWRSMLGWGSWASTGTSIYGRLNLHRTGGYLDTWWNNAERVTGSTSSLNSGTWHHLALTRSGNTFQYYLDGIADGSSYSNTVSFDLDVFLIGKAPDSITNFLGEADGQFNGKIDDVQVYNRALSVAEIGVAKSGGTTPVTPPGVYLAKSLADDGITEVKRYWHGGAMTPYGYVMGGGVDGTDRDSCQIYWPNVISSYTSATNLSYGLTRDLPPLPSTTHGPALVYHKGYLYQIGGAQIGSTYIGGVKRFDFSTNTWTTLTAAADGDSLTDPGLLTERYQHAACSFGDEIFVFGGAQWNNNGASIAKDSFAWNPDTKVIRKLAQIPNTHGGMLTDATLALRTSGMTAIPCGSAIYLFGGGLTWGSGGSGQVLKYIP